MMGYGGMMGYGFDGMGYYGLGFIWQIVWLVVIIAVIYMVINALSQNRNSGNSSTGGEGRALRILDERFARGEIDAEEYRRMKEEILR